MSIKTINVNKLKSLLDKDEAILIEVRKPAENQVESIPGAQFLPFIKAGKR